MAFELCLYLLERQGTFCAPETVTPGPATYQSISIGDDIVIRNESQTPSASAGSSRSGTVRRKPVPGTPPTPGESATGQPPMPPPPVAQNAEGSGLKED